MAEERIALAAVAGAHGVRGEVRLKLFAETLAPYREIWAGDRPLTLVSAGAKTARFAEINDRSAAEALRGTLLTVPRSALPPLEEGEYYHADLIGLPCVSPAGGSIGAVVAVENFGAGDILEIETPAGKRHMVPFKDGVADLVDGQVRVDPAFLA